MQLKIQKQIIAIIYLHQQLQHLHRRLQTSNQLLSNFEQMFLLLETVPAHHLQSNQLKHLIKPNA